MNTKKTKELLVFVLFILPALALVLFASDVPFVMNMYYSVFNWNGISRDMTFVGLDNFVKIFTNDSFFWISVKFTLKYALFFVIIVNIAALTIAMFLASERRSNSIARAFYYVPYIISMTAISLLWKFILGPGFSSLYQITGWEIFNWSWLGSGKLAFIVIVVMTTWQNIGYYIMNYITGIIAVPTELLEASRIDGASRIQTATKIMLPLIMPSISVCMLTSLTFSFKIFDVIMVFTKGGPGNSTASVAYNIYSEAFLNNNYGLATAKSVIFVIFVLCVTAIQTKITKGKEVEA